MTSPWAWAGLAPQLGPICRAANRLIERGDAIDVIHRVIGFATIAVVALGIGWSALLIASRRAGGPGFERFQAAVVSLIIVGAASGLLLFASGARPTETIHLLYAVIAIGLIPLARSFLGRPSGRASAALLLVALVALGGILYRLFTTG